MRKLLLLLVSLLSICSASSYVPPTFLGKLEKAVANADPQAFLAAFRVHPPGDRHTQGQWLWTMYIENKDIEYKLKSKTSNYVLPSDYEMNRNLLLSLLESHNFIATDARAGGLQVLQAVKENNSHAVEFLLNQGYPANVVDDHGQRPFEYALAHKYFTCARLILDNIQVDPEFLESYSPGFGRHYLATWKSTDPISEEIENSVYIDLKLQELKEATEAL